MIDRSIVCLFSRSFAIDSSEETRWMGFTRISCVSARYKRTPRSSRLSVCLSVCLSSTDRFDWDRDARLRLRLRIFLLLASSPFENVMFRACFCNQYRESSLKRPFSIENPTLELNYD